MYEKQTYSHKTRNFHNTYGKIFEAEKSHEKIYSKHFKTHYKGKPTKRYLHLMKQVESVTELDVQKALLI
jgi:hypothetical protein